MKKRLLSIFIVLSMLACMIPSTALTAFAGGGGDPLPTEYYSFLGDITGTVLEYGLTTTLPISAGDQLTVSLQPESASFTYGDISTECEYDTVSDNTDTDETGAQTGYIEISYFSFEGTVMGFVSLYVYYDSASAPYIFDYIPGKYLQFSYYDMATEARLECYLLVETFETAHVHTQGEGYLCNGDSHWHVCGTDDCPLTGADTAETVSNYLEAFADPENGEALMETLGYADHDIPLDGHFCSDCGYEDIDGEMYELGINSGDENLKEKFIAWKEAYDVTDFSGGLDQFLMNTDPSESVPVMAVESVVSTFNDSFYEITVTVSASDCDLSKVNGYLQLFESDENFESWFPTGQAISFTDGKAVIKFDSYVYRNLLKLGVGAVEDTYSTDCCTKAFRVISYEDSRNMGEFITFPATSVDTYDTVFVSAEYPLSVDMLYSRTIGATIGGGMPEIPTGKTVIIDSSELLEYGAVKWTLADAGETEPEPGMRCSYMTYIALYAGGMVGQQVHGQTGATRLIVPVSQDQLDGIESNVIVCSAFGGFYDMRSVEMIDCAYTYFYDGTTRINASDINLPDGTPVAAFIIIDNMGHDFFGRVYFQLFRDNESFGNLMVDAWMDFPNYN